MLAPELSHSQKQRPTNPNNTNKKNKTKQNPKGRTIWKDVGAVAIGFRLLEKLVDLNALFTLAQHVMHRAPDFQQQLRALREQASASKRR